MAIVSTERRRYKGHGEMTTEGVLGARASMAIVPLEPGCIVFNGE